MSEMEPYEPGFPDPPWMMALRKPGKERGSYDRAVVIEFIRQRRLTSVQCAIDWKNAKVLDRLARAFRVCVYQPSQHIFNEGDSADLFYIVIKGEVGIYNRRDPEPVSQYVTPSTPPTLSRQSSRNVSTLSTPIAASPSCILTSPHPSEIRHQDGGSRTPTETDETDPFLNLTPSSSTSSLRESSRNSYAKTKNGQHAPLKDNQLEMNFMRDSAKSTQIEHNQQNLQQLPVATMRRGHCFGHFALNRAGDGKRTATCTAHKRSVLLVLDRISYLDCAKPEYHRIQEERKTFVAAHQLFRFANPTRQLVLSHVLESLALGCGSTVYRHGDLSACVYLVVSGQLTVTSRLKVNLEPHLSKSLKGGNNVGWIDVPIATIGPGGYFGEEELLPAAWKRATELFLDYQNTRVKEQAELNIAKQGILSNGLNLKSSRAKVEKVERQASSMSGLSKSLMNTRETLAKFWPQGLSAIHKNLSSKPTQTSFSLGDQSNVEDYPQLRPPTAKDLEAIGAFLDINNSKKLWTSLETKALVSEAAILGAAASTPWNATPPPPANITLAAYEALLLPVRRDDTTKDSYVEFGQHRKVIDSKVEQIHDPQPTSSVSGRVQHKTSISIPTLSSLQEDEKQEEKMSLSGKAATKPLVMKHLRRFPQSKKQFSFLKSSKDYDPTQDQFAPHLNNREGKMDSNSYQRTNDTIVDDLSGTSNLPQLVLNLEKRRGSQANIDPAETLSLDLDSSLSSLPSPSAVRRNSPSIDGGSQGSNVSTQFDMPSPASFMSPTMSIAPSFSLDALPFSEEENRAGEAQRRGSISRLSFEGELVRHSNPEGSRNAWRFGSADGLRSHLFEKSQQSVLSEALHLPVEENESELSTNSNLKALGFNIPTEWVHRAFTFPARATTVTVHSQAVLYKLPLTEALKTLHGPRRTDLQNATVARIFQRFVRLFEMTLNIESARNHDSDLSRHNPFYSSASLVATSSTAGNEATEREQEWLSNIKNPFKLPVAHITRALNAHPQGEQKQKKKGYAEPKLGVGRGLGNGVATWHSGSWNAKEWIAKEVPVRDGYLPEEGRSLDLSSIAQATLPDPKGLSGDIRSDGERIAQIRVPTSSSHLRPAGFEEYCVTTKKIVCAEPRSKHGTIPLDSPIVTKPMTSLAPADSAAVLLAREHQIHAQLDTRFFASRRG